MPEDAIEDIQVCFEVEQVISFMLDGWEYLGEGCFHKQIPATI